jgi:hypothetical protein
MASFGNGNYIVILGLVRGASAGDVQFVLQREAQSGKVWFPAGGILPNATNVVKATQVLLRETAVSHFRAMICIWYAMN